MDRSYRNERMIHLIDTAAVYMNEEGVGRAIKSSGIAREEFFITTKLWVQDVSCEKIKIAFDTSMNKLGLDYLDLYLIHQPFNDYYGAWRGMEELLINQVETHPFYQQTTADYLSYMKPLHS